MSTSWKVKMWAFAVLVIAMSPGIVLAGDDVVVDGETKYFYSDAVIDNLTVKNGAVVWLQGATVKGNIIIEGTNSYAGSHIGCTIKGNAVVKDGGRLSMWRSRIDGNLQGEEYWYINWLISEVGGNVQLTGGGHYNAEYGPGKVGGDFKYEKGTTVWLNWHTVGGNVQVLENYAPGEYDRIFIVNCEIDGDLQVCKNDIGWYIAVENNTVGGNLEVKDNDPDATVEGNDVSGNEDVD